MFGVVCFCLSDLWSESTIFLKEICREVGAVLFETAFLLIMCSQGDREGHLLFIFVFVLCIGDLWVTELDTFLFVLAPY